MVLAISFGLMLSGCAGRKTPAPPAAGRVLEAVEVVIPAKVLVAKVVSVNGPGRFVVLNFPPGGMPLSGRHFSVYHADAKVAEVRISEWQDEDNAIADLVSGEARVGDDAREN